MDNQPQEIQFNDIQSLFAYGDASRIAAMTGRSLSICKKIIGGTRTPQPWFMEAAVKYLRSLGKIEDKPSEDAPADSTTNE
jgi:hypothetical protein